MLDVLAEVRVRTSAKSAVLDVLRDAVADCPTIDPTRIIRELLADIEPAKSTTPKNEEVPDPDTVEGLVSDNPEVKRRRSAQREAILRAIESLDDPCPEEIAKALGDTSEPAVHRLHVALSTMFRAGLVERPSRGRYRVRVSTERPSNVFDLGPRVLTPPATTYPTAHVGSAPETK